MVSKQFSESIGGEGTSIDEASSSMLEDASDDSLATSKIPVVPRGSVGHCHQLDAIVELNYEASSDEEIKLWNTDYLKQWINKHTISYNLCTFKVSQFKCDQKYMPT